MASRLGALRAAGRIAARDARRAKGRTALVATMIGLPLLVGTAGGTLLNSLDPTPEQVAASRLGDVAQAEITGWFDEGVIQGPLGHYGGWSSSGSSDAEQPSLEEHEAAVAAVLPAGSELVRASLGGGMTTSEERSRPSYTEILELPPDRLAELVSTPLAGGSLPREAGALLLDHDTAETFTVGVGDTLTVEVGAAEPVTATVAGVLEPAVEPTTILAPPGTLPADRDDAVGPWGAMPVRWFVFGDSPVTAEHVEQINALGSLVLSRHVVLHPETLDPMSTGSVDAGVVAVVGAVAAIALIEAILLIGPAFAVGAQRNQRQLAMIAATGGSSRTLRRVVLLGGVTTGLAASVLAVVLGLVTAALAAWVVNLVRPSAIPGLQVPWLVLPAIVVLGTVVATAAAWLPARHAGRLDVVAALAGRRAEARPRRRVAVVGAVLAGVGVAVALVGAGASQPSLVVGGVVALEIGIVATAGAIVALVSRLAPRLGVAGRFALRDAARQRSRTAPAVAAIFAALAGATAGAGFIASSEARSEATYISAGPEGTVIAGISPYESDAAVTADQLTALSSLVRATLPVEEVHTVAMAAPLGPDGGTTDESAFLTPRWPDGQECPLDEMGSPSTAELVEHADDPRCQRMAWAETQSLQSRLPDAVVVDDGTLMTSLGFPDAEEAAAALAAGRVVVSSPRVVHPDGTLHLDDERYIDGEDPRVVDTYELPATAADLGGSGSFDTFSMVFPPQVVQQLGLYTEDVGLLASTSRMPTDAEEAAASDALYEFDEAAYLGVERGPGDESLAVWIVVGAALVVGLGATMMSIALAQAETRPDLATLAAVGASPRLRRRVAAAQAGVLTLIGGVLGAGTGLLLATVIVTAMRHQWEQVDPHWQLVVPWPAVAAIGLGVPLLAMGAAWLFTRSRLPMVRRLAA